MTILKRPEPKQPKLVDVFYGYETSSGIRGCEFDTPDKAKKWFKEMTEVCPKFAVNLKPVKITVSTTKEPF